MVPLHWPEGQPKQVSGGLLTRLRQLSNAPSAFEAVAHQLRNRPRPEPERWGDTVTEMQVGQAISKVLKEMYEWPNDHFIPEDPFEVALFMPWDMHDACEVTLELNKPLGVELEYSELYDFSDGTLGDLADYLVSKIAFQ